MPLNVLLTRLPSPSYTKVAFEKAAGGAVVAVGVEAIVGVEVFVGVGLGPGVSVCDGVLVAPGVAVAVAVGVQDCADAPTTETKSFGEFDPSLEE